MTPTMTARRSGTADAGTRAGAGAGQSELRDLDSRLVLETIVDRRRAADAAEADLLALAVHYVDLHPVTDTRPAASWVPDRELAVTGQVEAPLAGVGTPGVAEYAVEALGAALDVSYRSALGLVSEAVELCFRLPRLYELVQTGRLQAWKARSVARETTSLSPAAVEFVDRHLAVHGARNRIPVNLKAVVHEALLRCDPEIAAGREEAALLDRDVVFDFHRSTATCATATMTATLDTLDALDLDATLSQLATSMGRLGDHSPLGVRRAHALGMLAHPQRVLDVFGEPRDPSLAPDTCSDEQAASHSWNASAGILYLHLDVSDLRRDADGTPGTGGSVERLGTATLDLLRDWLHRMDKVTIRPVLDLARSDAVDRHDLPGWMREAVMLRDGHCVFPGCTVDARSCDLDHIEPYVPLDDGGPPGQTGSANLACLCRRHHRLKTFTGWTYQRGPDDGYQWLSPLGLTYRSGPGSRR